MIILRYEIGARIRQYRELRGLSQKELAEMINISNNRLSNWEQGINRPNADILASICKALEVSPSELLNIHLDTDNLTEQERRLITAYRSKPDLQKSVNILLGIE